MGRISPPGDLAARVKTVPGLRHVNKYPPMVFFSAIPKSPKRLKDDLGFFFYFGKFIENLLGDKI